MGSCQNYGPFLRTLNNRCRTIIGTHKGTIILTTTHMHPDPVRAETKAVAEMPGNELQALMARFRFLGVQGLGVQGLGFRV